jgi:hypothetical protein
MKEEMSPERFAQQVAADFSDFVGRVFKDFDEEVHVGDFPYRPDWPLVGATDYGWTNPFVWLAIQYDVWDNVYVIGEYRAQQKDINDVARDLEGWDLARNASDLYPDPAEPGDSSVLSRRLHCRINSSTGGPLKIRLELIRKWLKLVPEDHPFEKRAPKLFIDRRCSDLIREMLDYRYPESKEESLRAAPEAPLDKDDHGPEALGRFFRAKYGDPSDGQATRAKVKRARILSG